MSKQKQKIDVFFQTMYNDSVASHKKIQLSADRKQYVNSSLRRALNIDGLIADTISKKEVIETVEYDSYIRERVTYQTAPNLWANMYVLTPKQGKIQYPAVLAVHGHGYGNKEIVGLTESGKEADHHSGIHKHFATHLVKCGLKVFAPEVIGFGERMLTRDMEEGKPYSCDSLARMLLMTGKTIAGLRVAEMIQMINHIENYADVDQSHIGMMGFSGGGLIAAYAAALDERIKATVLCGFTNTFQGSILDRNHCIDNYVPGLLNIAELPEIIGLIAPRHLFIESGKFDHLFPIESVKEAIAELTETYESLRSIDAFLYDLFDGQHEVSGQKSFDWLSHHLQLNSL